MNGQKRPLESDNKILSPEKLSGMMTISGKGTLIIILAVLVIVAVIYAGLFTNTLEQSTYKPVFYDGLINLDELYEKAGKAEYGSFSKEEIQFRLRNVWHFRENAEELAMFSTVLSGREYDHIAPVLGSEVVVDDKYHGYVALCMSIFNYDGLLEFGFDDTNLKEIDIWPGESIYYLLTILSDEINPDMEKSFYEGKLIMRKEELKSLLYVPAEKETN